MKSYYTDPRSQELESDHLMLVSSIIECAFVNLINAEINNIRICILNFSLFFPCKKAVANRNI